MNNLMITFEDDTLNFDSIHLIENRIREIKVEPNTEVLDYLSTFSQPTNSIDIEKYLEKFNNII